MRLLHKHPALRYRSTTNYMKREPAVPIFCSQIYFPRFSPFSPIFPVFPRFPPIFHPTETGVFGEVDGRRETGEGTARGLRPQGWLGPKGGWLGPNSENLRSAVLSFPTTRLNRLLLGAGSLPSSAYTAAHTGNGKNSRCHRCKVHFCD